MGDNTRPLFTPEDRQTFKFMLLSMRDDYNRYVNRVQIDKEPRDLKWEENWEKAEQLARRILGRDYP